MSTLVYSPDIRIHVETTNSGIIDISEDLVSGSIILRENAPHTAQWVLQNAQRKYDGRILPMDKVSIQLKRLNWMQIMTGYMNDPPIFQAFPGTLSMSATCTLKKPQFFATDTTTAAFQTMVFHAMGDNIVSHSKIGDSGLSKLIVDSMTQVLGWNAAQIHIGEVPKNWFKFIKPIIDKIQADEALYKAIGPSFTAAGSYGGVTTTLQPAQYAGRTVDATQAKNLSVVISTALGSSPTPALAEAIAVMCVMCVLVEAVGGYNYANQKVPGSIALPHDRVGSDGLSVGVFQQQVGPGFDWGPVGKCQDPATATQTFIDRLTGLLPKTPTESMYGYYVQKVQGSAYPDRYQNELDAAKLMVKQAMTVAAGSAGDGRVGGGVVKNPAAGFRATGSQIAKKSLDLIAAHKTSPISYHMSGDDPYDTPIADVKTLDCSSLVDWVYYNTTGKAFKQGRSIVGDYYNGCKLIPLAAAKEIQGAVCIAGPNEHIAVSTGNGTCVAAKTDGAPPGQQVVAGDPIDGQGFTDGGLLPGIDYSSSATTQNGKEALRLAGIDAKGLAPQLTSVSDPSAVSATQDGAQGSPFASLVNNIIVNADTSSNITGNAIGGKAALINDVYFLPWLQSVVNASMRSFCSAPNGDFIAWFPDYFGTWGQAGVVNIETIELQNFEVRWSDQQLVTHQFVLGNLGASILDAPSGSVGTNSPANDLVALATGTAGIASLDYPEIFNLIYGETAPSGFIQAFLSRFGARPDVQQMANVPHGAAEFFMAVYLFIQRWAAQFVASIPLTFMPELFPGMLIRIPSLGFQAYVQGVTHQFSFGDGGGFTTTADICAPSNTASNDRSDLLSLLPIGGKRAT